MNKHYSGNIMELLAYLDAGNYCYRVTHMYIEILEPEMIIYTGNIVNEESDCDII